MEGKRVLKDKNLHHFDKSMNHFVKKKRVNFGAICSMNACSSSFYPSVVILEQKRQSCGCERGRAITEVKGSVTPV